MDNNCLMHPNLLRNEELTAILKEVKNITN